MTKMSLTELCCANPACMSREISRGEKKCVETFRYPDGRIYTSKLKILQIIMWNIGMA